MTLSSRRAALGMLATAAFAAAIPAGASAHARSAATTASLSGTLKIRAGTFAAGKPAGSYFRMALPGGANYFANPGSSATDKSYTLLKPGTAGGLVLGKYQSAAPFDASGNSQAGAIIRPTPFAGILFGVATLRREPAGAPASAAPSATLKGSKLSVQISALTAAWNKLFFNQGTPKPGSRKPLATGTFKQKTNAYTLDWRSTIAGGPFNGFTGVWHLEGTFKGKLR
ncbi:MAG TPA: hypothetical protein VII98_01835 [Solirubrobacteraceae bacterium]